MWVNPGFLVFFGFLHVTQAEREFPDEQSIVHIDVQRLRPRSWKSHQSNGGDIEGAFKVQWTGNGDFQARQVEKSSLERELPPWDSQVEKGSEEDTIDPEPSLPSSILQPPFEFYSSSIHDFANEDTTLSNDFETSSDNNSTIKTLRIYEITKSNSSRGFRKGNAITAGRSFVISDPSSETKSSNSLRSVIRNKNLTRLNGVNRGNDSGGSYSGANGVDDRSGGIKPRTNVIRANSGKGNAPRGNRKYQARVDSDETLVRRNSWGNTRDNWRRPVNRPNHFRFSGQYFDHYIFLRFRCESRRSTGGCRS
ncbi:uncharacterized protein [Fopius arisanus]|uniref:Uncharacterized protein isoform X2 n=2 Tax=Fopius arisanus TaxID=64838 RepID=A0A9R1T3N5_9HYME|nr:PREDICTED: uncharacterized protein LOC105266190 isoform X2 [Fopius arisanus]